MRTTSATATLAAPDRKSHHVLRDRNEPKPCTRALRMNTMIQDLVKLTRRHKPPAIIAYIIDEDGGSDCTVAGVHPNAVEIARRLARRMDKEWQTITERLQQDHAALHHVSSETLSAVLDELAPAVEIDQ